MLTWIGAIVLSDGTQFAERGEVRFLPGHRAEVRVVSLGGRAGWSAVVDERSSVAALPWDDWQRGPHLFVGVRCGVPVRHTVALDGGTVRSVTTRLDTGMVTQAAWPADATVADWCARLLAGIGPLPVIGTARA